MTITFWLPVLTLVQCNNVSALYLTNFIQAINNKFQISKLFFFRVISLYQMNHQSFDSFILYHVLCLFIFCRVIFLLMIQVSFAFFPLEDHVLAKRLSKQISQCTKALRTAVDEYNRLECSPHWPWPRFIYGRRQLKSIPTKTRGRNVLLKWSYCF